MWNEIPFRASIPPEAMMHFPLVSEFPLISIKYYPEFAYSEKKFRFSSAKISEDSF